MSPRKFAVPCPGVVHTGEIQFISNSVSGSEPDRRMAERASAFWVQFAKTRNPNPPGQAEWPAYRANSDQVLELGGERGPLPQSAVGLCREALAGRGISARVSCSGNSALSSARRTKGKPKNAPMLFAAVTPCSTWRKWMATNCHPPRFLRPRSAFAHAEEFFARIPASVRHHGNSAYYRPADDQITLPAFAAFFTPMDYYSTRAHETGHWTAPKHRLDRELGKRFGDSAYAVEELVAEVTAAFTMAHLQLSQTAKITAIELSFLFHNPFSLRR